MSTTDKYLNCRGQIQGIAGAGGTLLFVTVHPEGQPTALYRLDCEKLTLEAEPLPQGGVALALAGEVAWIAGTEGIISQSPIKGGKPRALGPPIEPAPTALVPLADDRLGVLAGSKLVIFTTNGQGNPQTLELPDPGTCLAADPSGRWLAVGMSKGEVAVFEAEGQPEFALSDSSKLHEGAVTALLFEPEELRFFSAGADLKLLSTHARGRLEPEDKGKGVNHSDTITAMAWGPGDRLYTGSRDATIKNWPRVGGVRPATLKDGVAKVVALALVTVLDRPRLVVAGEDQTLRIFPIDAGGKIGELAHRIHDAYQLARQEFQVGDPKRREAALKSLASIGDAAANELIAQQSRDDDDHALRLLAAQHLSAAEHPRAVKLLENLLEVHQDEAVRVEALAGLRRHLGADDLRPLDLALKTAMADVGRLAVEALGSLAARDEQALDRLLGALDSLNAEVRLAALSALETVYDPGSPEADLNALNSIHADLRRRALVRLFERKMLADPAVPIALRRRAEDADAEVRRAAFLLALHTRPKLVETLRTLDPELNRQLNELEGSATPTPTEPAPPKRGKAKAEKKSADRPTLAAVDLEPLLQSTASRSLDTCLRGARGLAVLGDPRAFGLLLQLSREPEASARVEVCRALASLGDPRSVNRLRSMLDDTAPEVRDAAFSALATIHLDDPLHVAESGLVAQFEDVRRRGLQALIAEVRKAPPRSPEEPAWPMLVRALNDSFPGVRSEAFKAALNLQVGGAGAGPLRFARRSIYDDIRKEVLTEVMAQIGQPWAWDLLLEAFDDHDPNLRREAFEFATKKSKGLEPLEAALASRYADLRKRAVEALIKKSGPSAQTLLVGALADEDRDVRLLALDSLISVDARPALTEALGSPKADIRLRAAKALAQHGDPAAFDPLLELATAPMPDETERRPDWLDLAESALDGLGELGDPKALVPLIPILDSAHAELRKQAARALVWIVRPETLDALGEAVSHADAEVRQRAALGLTCLGDAEMAPFVLDPSAVNVLKPAEQIAAATALGPSGESWLVGYLDDNRDAVQSRALLILLLQEWKAPRGDASRLLAALSSRFPRVRLTAADALESIADPAALRAFLTKLINNRGEKPAWTIPEETVETLAELLVHAEPQLRARTAHLLRHLDAKQDEQSAWDVAWKAYAERFARVIATLRDHAGQRVPVPSQYSPEELLDLAFGAYVGLVREPAAEPGRKGTAGPPQGHHVRQTALNRILALARRDPRSALAVIPVFLQALGDPNQAVRLLAFEHLQTLGIDAAKLGAEALGAGPTDIGIKGLEVLSGGASAEQQGQAVLEQVAITRKDDLAIEAARLLIAHRGAVAVASRALEAAHEPLRQRAVAWLTAEYDNDDQARDALRQALRSRYTQVRRAAALALAQKKDPAAFDALVTLLKEAQDPKAQREVIEALVSQGDPRAPAALLDRIENDPGGTALADELLRAAGNFRLEGVADRILDLMDRNRHRRNAAFDAVLSISGDDQPIDDPDDDRPGDRQWLEKQHPRRATVLARLLERCFALGETRLLVRLLPAARWAPGNEVEPGLALLTNHADDALRRLAIEALGWRFRKRTGAANPLVKALGHRDPVSQFLAAEALARGGKAEGLSVLLSAIDFLSDLHLRRRAVEALGELADERAIDTLLKLAAEDGHALQEPAAEAIGHFRLSPRADEVFKLLERHAKRVDDIADPALKGLRWLDRSEGWRIIRGRILPDRIAEGSGFDRSEAIGLLGHNDDPATRDLLLRILSKDEDEEDVLGALAAARKLWGEDALEPDYALLQNKDLVLYDLPDEPMQQALDRVRRRGDPARIIEVLPRCSLEVQQGLAASLLNRADPPLTEARAALDSHDPGTVELAARLLGRAGKNAADAKGQLAETLKTWRNRWEADRSKADHSQGSQQHGRARFVSSIEYDDKTDFDRLTIGLDALVWAAGRLGVDPGILADLAAARPDDPLYRPIRRSAVAVLADLEKPGPAVLETLESVAQGDDPEIRALASQALGRFQPKRAAKLAEFLLADRTSFDRLARQSAVDSSSTLRGAVSQLHYQGVVLPHLVARGEVEPLATVAQDSDQPEAARLGAIEGLGRLASEVAEQHLRHIGADDKIDEELRKAAWRALRRSKRARQPRKRRPAEVSS